MLPARVPLRKLGSRLGASSNGLHRAACASWVKIARDIRMSSVPLHRSEERLEPMSDRKVAHRGWARACLGAALVTMLAVTESFAQDAAASYPSKPIRIVVGFAPGGPTDRIAREVALGLQEAWGQPVIVENKPGAGSRIAFEFVARSDPDGHTLLLGALQTATNMSVYRQLNYDTLRDFAPVTQLTSTVLALAVTPSLEAKTVADLVAIGRSRPGELTYASFGVASSAHFAGTLLEQRAGMQMTHVPYNGAAPAQAAIIAGQVNLGFMSALSAMPLMQSGKLRALAVTADKRLAQLPDVPTMAEAGFPEFEVSSWQGLLAPAKTPPPIVAKLHREIARILARPEVRERFAAVAAEPVASSPTEFRAYIQSEIAKWAVVAKRAGMVLD
jgi:tripartite-type tricarboxylate transporter receptor subunit TctC